MTPTEQLYDALVEARDALSYLSKESFDLGRRGDDHGVATAIYVRETLLSRIDAALEKARDGNS